MFKQKWNINKVNALYKMSGDDELKRYLLGTPYAKYVPKLEEMNVLNTTTIFTKPIISLSYLTGIAIEDLRQILTAITRTMHVSMSDTAGCNTKVIFGDPIIDATIPLPSNGLIELVGLSGSGKTNIAAQMAVTAAAGESDKCVLIINTEGPFPVKRIHQIAFSNQYDVDPRDIIDRIKIQKIDRVEELTDFVDGQLPLICQNQKVALLIIDSVAAPYRTEFDKDYTAARSVALFNLSTTLKYYSETFQFPVILVNQATADMDQFRAGESDWKPALGISWSYCISFRLIVSKTSLKREITPTLNPQITSPQKDTIPNKPTVVPIRRIRAEISPLRQNTVASFYIDEAGIHGV